MLDYPRPVAVQQELVKDLWDRHVCHEQKPRSSQNGCLCLKANVPLHVGSWGLSDSFETKGQSVPTTMEQNHHRDGAVSSLRNWIH